jgi:hypothetical protein
MANLQIKGIDDRLYAEIKRMAARENRSISQQVLFLVREYLSRRGRGPSEKPAATRLLELAGSWEDRRSAPQIVADLRAARKNSRRLNRGL